MLLSVAGSAILAPHCSGGWAARDRRPPGAGLPVDRSPRGHASHRPAPARRLRPCRARSAGGSANVAAARCDRTRRFGSRRAGAAAAGRRSGRRSEGARRRAPGRGRALAPPHRTRTSVGRKSGAAPAAAAQPAAGADAAAPTPQTQAQQQDTSLARELGEYTQEVGRDAVAVVLKVWYGLSNLKRLVDGSTTIDWPHLMAEFVSLAQLALVAMSTWYALAGCPSGPSA